MPWAAFAFCQCLASSESRPVAQLGSSCFGGYHFLLLHPSSLLAGRCTPAEFVFLILCCSLLKFRLFGFGCPVKVDRDLLPKLRIDVLLGYTLGMASF